MLAMGIGGMIGGGIFSVLGMAVNISGHAAPMAFLLGSFVALAAGYSYVKLALGFQSDGASFTFLDRAFPEYPNVAGIAGWTVIVGYVGTLALYAYTFGVYGAHLLGDADSPMVRMMLSLGVLLFFLLINLQGVQSSGRTEVIIVFTKVILLGLFALAGTFSIKEDHLFPVFDQGVPSIFIAGAMIFVAFEGFQLITNAVLEAEKPKRNIPRGIYGSILITSLIYFGVAIVAVGNLTPVQIESAKEYTLAVAAKPALGNTGAILVDLAALLATSSAVNATIFGASRMMADMANENRMPQMFALRTKAKIPWVAIVFMTALASGFTLLGSLETITLFSSLVFLLVSIAVSVANLKLRSFTHSNLWLILLGIGLMLSTVTLLVIHLWSRDSIRFFWLLGFFATIAVLEISFCWYRCRNDEEFHKKHRKQKVNHN
nr:APC family permease [Gimesia panareensis]